MMQTKAAPPLDVGEAVELRRRELKIKQEVLSQECNMSQSTLSRIEQGLIKPNAMQLRCLGAALGVQL